MNEILELERIRNWGLSHNFEVRNSLSESLNPSIEDILDQLSEGGKQ